MVRIAIGRLVFDITNMIERVLRNIRRSRIAYERISTLLQGYLDEMTKDNDYAW